LAMREQQSGSTVFFSRKGPFGNGQNLSKSGERTLTTE
jgi:hypothetical protein